MNRDRLTTLLCVALLACFSAPLLADQHEKHDMKMSTMRADYLAEIDGIEKKIVGLAEAIPADKYEWRPGEGVRSVSESLMHVAAGNYFFLGPLGVEGPEGVDPRSLEKTVTSKDAVVKELKRSFEYARKAIKHVSDDELDEMVSMFGQEWPKRKVLLLYVTHGHEHLGQMIAYARSNDVTPPWSS